MLINLHVVIFYQKSQKHTALKKRANQSLITNTNNKAKTSSVLHSVFLFLTEIYSIKATVEKFLTLKP